MAIKFFRSIDITGNEIQNVKLHNIANIAASSGNLGQIYFDTTSGDKKVKVNSDYASAGTYVMEPLAFETWVSANFNNYTLPVATNSALGGIKIGYTESGKNYPVELDGNNKAFVNVPWTDTSALTTEQVQDIVGGMVDGGTETRIAVSYDDTNGKLGFVVDDMNYTHPNHSGQVTSSGDGATTLSTTAITAQTDLGGAPASGDSMLIYDTSDTSLKEMTIANLQSYMQSSLDLYNISVMGDDDGTSLALADGGKLHIHGGTAIETADSSITGGVKVTVDHSDVTNTASTGTALTPGYGANFNVITGVTVNDQGHVTDVETTNVTIPASDQTDTTPVVNNTTAAAQPVVFVADAGSDPDLRVDGTGTNDFTYNPSTQTLSVANLTVAGTTTTLNTETVTIDDNIIVLNNNATGSATADAGIEVERGNDANVSLFWDESEDKWTVTNTSGTYQILQSVGGTTFKVTLAASSSFVSKASNTYTVTHSLGTKDVIIQVIDVSGGSPTYETVFTENQRPTDDTVTIAFANTVTDGDYRVLISQV